LTPENFRIGITVADTYGQVITNYPEKTFFRVKIKLIEAISEAIG
jgi:S-adenosylmethionine hydrolase